MVNDEMSFMMRMLLSISLLSIPYFVRPRFTYQNKCQSSKKEWCKLKVS